MTAVPTTPLAMPIRLPGTGPDVEPRKARKWRIFWSYLPDWVLTIFLWVRVAFAGFFPGGEHTQRVSYGGDDMCAELTG